ncbi:Pbi2 protein [Martiniozyma asiatica (nom. inval.)]|nr:Pbi2 protein [Martiniozyma asiatica]
MSTKSYIITLKENANTEKFKDFLNSIGAEVKHEYTLIKGFAVKLPELQVSSLHSNEGVATVEEDKEVKIQ